MVPMCLLLRLIGLRWIDSRSSLNRLDRTRSTKKSNPSASEHIFSQNDPFLLLKLTARLSNLNRRSLWPTFQRDYFVLGPSYPLTLWMHRREQQAYHRCRCVREKYYNSLQAQSRGDGSRCGDKNSTWRLSSKFLTSSKMREPKR